MQAGSARGFAIVMRLVVVSLVLNLAFPLGGLPAVTALAPANGEVQLDPDLAPGETPPAPLPPTPPTPAPTPWPVVAYEADAPIVPVIHPTAEPVVPPTPAPSALPAALTLSVFPTEATPGTLVTYTLTLVNGATPLNNLELQAVLHPTLHRVPGQPGQYTAATRTYTLALADLAANASATYTFRARVAGIPDGDFISQAFTVAQTSVARAATAIVRIHMRAAPGLSQAGPAGGQLVSPDGRVRVDFPPGALTSVVRLEQDWVRLGDMQVGNPRRFFWLELNATELATGNAVHTFNAPVTLTLRLGDLIPTGQSFVLEYLNETTRQWEIESGPLTPDPVTGLVQVRLSHFSAFGGGDPSKEGWKLLFNDANTGLFNGSINYSYPIAVPAGVHGLQPTLALNYSSARANGQLGWIQSDFAGLGWSTDAVEITRKIGWGSASGGFNNLNRNQERYNDYYPQQCAYEGSLCFSDDFTLVFHGAGYPLIQDLSDPNLYHTEDESFLKVRRVSCTSACLNGLTNGREVSNEGGYFRFGGTPALRWDYWEVTSQDGTVYRLGARADSEQRLDRVCISFGDYDPPMDSTWHGCGGEESDVLDNVVYRWRADLVTDVYGNQMAYHYSETSAAAQGYANLNGRTTWDRESYLDYIGYTWRPDLGGWGYEVVFDLLCRNDAPTTCGTTESATINDATATYGDNLGTLWFQRKMLNGIRVMQMTTPTSGTIIREYRLAYITSGDRITGTNSAGLPSRVLTGITAYGKGGYGVSGALPATTFAYTPLQNYTFNENYVGTDQYCTEYEYWPTYPYGRLSTIDNGYGAQITLTYTSDIATTLCHNDGRPRQMQWRVAGKTVTDNVNPAAYTSYSYDWPCYDSEDMTCHTKPDAGLVGYGIVTETVYNGANAQSPLFQRSEHRFFPDTDDWGLNYGLGPEWNQAKFALNGREKRVRVFNAQNQLISDNTQVYTTTLLVDRTGLLEPGMKYPLHDVYFIHQDETLASAYNAGSSTPFLQTRAASVYETTYGKVTTQYSYGATRFLTNGGFEQGLNAQGLNGWGAFNTNGGTYFNLSTPTASAAIGNNGLSLTWTGASNGSCDCGILQVVSTNIQPGTAYRIFARVRWASTSGPNFRLYVDDGNGGNTQAQYLTPTSAWQVVSVDYTATASAQLRLFLALRSGGQVGAPGTVQVDDVYFERVADTSDETTGTTSYVSNAGPWIVGLPSEQKVYTGTTPVALAARTVNIFDNGGTLNHGTLTEQRAYPSATGSAFYATLTSYDTFGNPVQLTDPRGMTATVAYDAYYHTYPLNTTNALNQRTTLRYDFTLGQVLTVTNANLVDTYLQYDAFGRLTKVIEDGDTTANPTVQYNYYDTYLMPGTSTSLLRIETLLREQSNTGNLRPLYEFYTGRGLLMQTRAETVDATTQAVSRVTYDALGRTLRAYSPLAATYSTDYQASQFGPAWSETGYDAQGRPSVVTATDGTISRVFYDGFTTTTVDANNHQKQSVTDARGQLITVREYTGAYPNATLYATTVYTYNLAGQLIATRDNASRVTTMFYDSLGRKLKMNDPSMGLWTYAYDANSNLTTQLDALNTRTCFYYDKLNRPLGKLYQTGGTCPADPGSAGYTQAYTYDQGPYGLGQRTAMTNTSAIVTWTYDRRGRAATETRTLPGLGTYSFRSTYDTANRVTGVTYPTGETLTNTYTAAWQPLTLASSWRTYITDAQYNVRGQPTSRTARVGASGTQATAFTYFGDAGEAQSFRLKSLNVGGGSLLNLSYTYDAIGNVANVLDATNSNQKQCFQYDALDRLSAAWTQGSGNCGTYANVGAGVYNHTGTNAYTYGTVGNIATLGGRTYVYDTQKSQAARYTYNLGSTAGRFADFTSSAAGWTLCATCALDTDTVTGEPVLRHGTGTTAATSVYSNAVSLSGTDTLQIEFQASTTSGALETILGLETGEAPAGDQRFGIIAQSGNALQMQRKVTTLVKGVSTVTWSYDALAPTLVLQPGTWYVLRLTLGDANNPFRAVVWKRADPSTRQYYELAAGNIPASWLNQTWRFRNWVNFNGTGSGTQVWLDSYFELKSGGSVYNYRYDANGNMLARTEQGIGYAQSWDAENHLIGVTYGLTSTTSQYTFAYDPDGTRVSQRAPGGTLGVQTAYVGPYEVTITPTLQRLDTFASGSAGWNWQIGTGGAWSVSANTYQQTTTTATESTTLRDVGTNYGDFHAFTRVRLTGGTNAFAGLIFRRSGTGSDAYIFALRDSLSTLNCGIYKKTAGTWAISASGGTACKVALNTWHTIGVRMRGGLIEASVDGIVVATWTDTTPLSAGTFGLATWGAATFDDVTLNVVPTVGDELRAYYSFGNARVAERVWAGATAASAGTVYLLAGDQLGSVSAIAKGSDGTLVGTRAYYLPFGEVRGAAVSGWPTDFGFTGERSTASIGLSQMGARWYDPKLGRWTSADTIVPDMMSSQSLNRYTYVKNNPLHYIDPSGHKEECARGEEESCQDWVKEKHQFIAPSSSFHFTRLPVQTNDLDWIQWFGTTDRAYQNKGSNTYAYSQKLHGGLDLGGEVGKDVYAGVEGEVIGINSRGTYFLPGNITIRAGGKNILLAHIKVDETIKLGAIVHADTIVGSIGSADGLPWSPHVHVEIRTADETGEIYNPLQFISRKDYGLLQSVVQLQIDNKLAIPEITFDTWNDNTFSDPLYQPVITHSGAYYW